MTLIQSRFLEANQKSPVVYAGIDAHCVTYRLANGTTWRFARREAREIGAPQFAHLVGV